jgi:transposase
MPEQGGEECFMRGNNSNGSRAAWKRVLYDREAYKRRNLIERCVNRLKQFRRIATRYEKTARAFVSMLCIAAARLWIKTVNTA